MNYSVTEGMEMEGEVSRTLPEDLVEKIIASMPYPSIFKARLLSRSWNDRFEPILRLDNEEGRRRAQSFHQLVAERSHSWDTFCPVYTNEGDPTVFNQIRRKWQKLPSLEWLSFLPLPEVSLELHLRESVTETVDVDVRLGGAFLYGSYRDEDNDMQKVHVANILTKEWKQLAGRPKEDCTDIRYMQLVIDPSSEAYKLIVVCEGESAVEGHFLQIYDSKSKTWRSNEFVNDECHEPGYAFLNGVFYIAMRGYAPYLLAFDVEGSHIEELGLALTSDKLIETIELVVCEGNLLIILFDQVSNRHTALTIDLMSQELLEVARCPAPHLLDTIDTRDSDANFIFSEMAYSFDMTDMHRRVLGYNKLKDEWKFFASPMDGFHWPRSNCSFQPGLNPFMAV